MMLDKNTLEKILKLPDQQLIMIIKSIAAQNGIDINNMNITELIFTFRDLDIFGIISLGFQKWITGS